MAKFFKHVGTHNGKKIVIIQRSLPGEDHMAAVVYSEILPGKYHDDVMKLLESVEGQDSNEFRDILGRRIGSEGGNLLNALSQEGYIKKVPAAGVIVKPNSVSAVRLDELNSLLKMAGEGAVAQSKLEDMERKQGYKDNRKIDAPNAYNSPELRVLSDEDLAQNSLSQAVRFRAEAKRLEEEAVRLEKEAESFNPLKAKRGKKSKTAA